MKRKPTLTLILFSLILLIGFSRSSNGQVPSSKKIKEKDIILQAISDYNESWKTGNVDLAIKHYADSIRWINSVGDEIRTQQELKEYLSFIFTLDFVIAAERIQQGDEVTFIAPDIATVSSLHIESKHKNYHLRIFRKINGQWKIINHITSREHPKE